MGHAGERFGGLRVAGSAGVAGVEHDQARSVGAAERESETLTGEISTLAAGCFKEQGALLVDRIEITMAEEVQDMVGRLELLPEG